MTVLVRTPPGWPTERRYVLDVVLGHWWGLHWHHRSEERDDVRIEVDGLPGGVVLPDGLFAHPSRDWLAPRTLPVGPRPWRPVGAAGPGVLRVDERLPVLYGSDRAEGDLLAATGDDERVDVDVLGGVFLLLSRYEEHLPAERDRHDRFPAAASVAAREGFLRRAVVDAYVELLWRACARRWPRLERRVTTYAVAITHDVDDPISTLDRGPVDVVRQLGGDLLLRRDAGLCARRARAALTAHRGRHDADPNNTFDLLMDVSERHGLRSAFYFLAHNDVDPDGPRYRLFDHPWVRRLPAHVHERGHEVGLHTAFGTYRDPARVAEEFTALQRFAADAGVDQSRWGGRQHYLQWHPETWSHWAAAGLDYDCTLAYADAAGFRTGTSRPFPVFDVRARRALPLVEEPFQVMDVTLFGYEGLSPDAARATTLEIAAECRRFGGTLGLLWHNDSLLRTRRQQRWYAELVEALVHG